MFLVPCLFVLVPCPFVLVPTPYSYVSLVPGPLSLVPSIPSHQFQIQMLFFFVKRNSQEHVNCLVTNFLVYFLYSCPSAFPPPSLFFLCSPPFLLLLLGPLLPTPPLLQGLNSPFVYSRISLYEYKGICLGMQGLHMHILSSVSKYRVSHGKIKFYIIYNTSYIVYLDKCFLKTILRVNICDYIAALFLYKLRQLQ